MLFAQEKIVSHTVAAKESYSSIGRLYNINGRVLAKYNNLDYDKGLSIGQVLKVPVTGASPVKAEIAASKPPKVTVSPEPANIAGSAPIKHIVGKKETLYGVSKKYNTTVANIKKWNNLTVDGLNEGSEIIVGYGNASSEGTEKSPNETTTIVIEKSPVITPKPPPVVTPKPVAVTVTPKPIAENNTGVSGGNFNGGIFRNIYSAGNRSETGTAGIFKSTSGWEDGKYYCLHNAAPQGSILKITNTANNKTVYAKVLGTIPDLKQNGDLLIRLSNSAADAVGAAGNFECSISY
jgi:LysM repeat protein